MFKYLFRRNETAQTDAGSFNEEEQGLESYADVAIDRGFLHARRQQLEAEHRDVEEVKQSNTPEPRPGVVVSYKNPTPRDSECKSEDQLTHVFEEFHKELDEREKLLDKKLQSIEKMQERETRLLKWVSLPIAVIALLGMLFLFYIAYSVQRSVSSMSSNMAVMSGDIAEMTTDTRSMSSNMGQMTGSIGTMNQSVQHMDYNMARMTRDVSQLNRSTRMMSRSMAPVAQAAENANPMLGMMRKFMSF